MLIDEISRRKGEGEIPASVLMIAATLLFATMSMCVKLASAEYGTGEMVFYRGLIGAVIVSMLARRRGITLRTSVPALHFWRSLTGVCALGLWFYAIEVLPLSTAVTLNYTAPIWMAVLLIGGSVFLNRGRPDTRLIGPVFAGFAGAICILRPAIQNDQTWGGFVGLFSGLLTAMAYLQVAALGRAGEPDTRVVFFFSIASMGGGALVTFLGDGWHAHTLHGLGLLLAVGLLATLAQLLLTRAYAIGKLLVNGSLQYLGIAWSYLYGVLLFGDRITGVSLLGMGLIALAGIAATALREPLASPGEMETPERL
ncbi:MAG: hypothetical protein ABS69_22665 [Nitrosomonadales bacterium SCN 54-20]|nr:MAG: hypothetical protein ABS69_22665 [Nitrosomonadales bacterium SCN 54-20]